MKNEITYTQQGNYLLPDLKSPEQPKVKIGIGVDVMRGIYNNIINFAISICLRAVNSPPISLILTSRQRICSFG